MSSAPKNPALPQQARATQGTRTPNTAAPPAKASSAAPPAAGAQNATATAQKEAPPRKRIFVGGLPFDITRLELHELCSTYGRVIDCESRRGYGFVTFESEDDADYTRYRLKDKEWRGCTLTADWSAEKPKQQGDPEKQKKKVGGGEKAPVKKFKKAEMSLKNLTPVNPATDSIPAAAPRVQKPAPPPGPAQPEQQGGGGQRGRGNRGNRGGRGGAGGGKRGGRGGTAAGGRNGAGNDAQAGANAAVQTTASVHPTPNTAATKPAQTNTHANTNGSSVANNNNNNNATGANAKRRRARKRGGAGAAPGGLFEITVRNVDTGEVTATLHMNETEVKKHIYSLQKEQKEL